MGGICEEKHRPVAPMFPVKKGKKGRNLLFAARAPLELVSLALLSPAELGMFPIKAVPSCWIGLGYLGGSGKDQPSLCHEGGI